MNNLARIFTGLLGAIFWFSVAGLMALVVYLVIAVVA
jgi:hypothetical protein